MGNIRTHIQNGIKHLCLYATAPKPDFIKRSIENNMHITFDNFFMTTVKETETQLESRLIIDFGDVELNYTLKFEKRNTQVKTQLNVRPVEFISYRLVSID